MSYISETSETLKNIFSRFKKRDFSGDGGVAIKNSTYQFSTNILAKVGSLVFTVVIARLLMPELFGLYSLALSTILVFNALSELGVSETTVRFISQEWAKKGKNKNLRSYLLYFGKIKIILIFFSSILILIFARYISEIFYQKPIFLALLAGILYILTIQILGFFQSILQASNHFASVLKREAVFQIFRIILVPLVVLFSIRYSLSSEIHLSLIILTLSLSLFLAFLFLFFDAIKIYRKEFTTQKKSNLPKNKKRTINKFLLATFAISISGMFSSNIDKIMLGKFLPSEFVGYYAAASSLNGAIVSIIGFSAVALLPIFSRLKRKNLEKNFKKSRGIIFLLSILTFLGTFILSYLAIFIIYGGEYLPSVNVLKFLSPLLIILPVSSIYQAYFISQGKPKILAKLMITTSIINIVLNYFLITILTPYGFIFGVYGTAAATLISQGIYLCALILNRRSMIHRLKQGNIKR